MERTRSRNPALPTTVGRTLYNEYYPDVNSSNHNTYTYTGSGPKGLDSYEETTDVVTPDFKERSAKGEIINNPYSRFRTDVVWPGPQSFYWSGEAPAAGKTTRSVWRGAREPNLIGYDFWDNASFNTQMNNARESARDSAVTQAFANIDESEMLALATLAESGKTVASAAAILKRVFSLARSLRKLDFKALAKEISPSELSDRYMEVRYAVRPFMYDLVGLLQGLEKTIETTRQTYRGVASESCSLSGVAAQDHVTMTEVRYDVAEERKYSVTARAGVLCDVEISNVTIWGIDKIPESLWELVPFSFIVDWFCNVGDTIAALTPNAGVKQRASWVVLKEICELTHRYHSPSGPPSGYNNQVVNAPEFTLKWSHRVTTRTTDPQVSVWPQVDLNLDQFKLADLAIIGRKIFR